MYIYIYLYIQNTEVLVESSLLLISAMLYQILALFRNVLAQVFMTKITYRYHIRTL
jgi:hypothetical protein